MDDVNDRYYARRTCYFSFRVFRYFESLFSISYFTHKGPCLIPFSYSVYMARLQRNRISRSVQRRPIGYTTEVWFPLEFSFLHSGQNGSGTPRVSQVVSSWITAAGTWIWPLISIQCWGQGRWSYSSTPPHTFNEWSIINLTRAKH
jgi:hypothetical protein